MSPHCCVQSRATAELYKQVPSDSQCIRIAMPQRKNCQQGAKKVAVIKPDACEPLEQFLRCFLSSSAGFWRCIIEEVPCVGRKGYLIRRVLAWHGDRSHAHLIQADIV